MGGQVQSRTFETVLAWVCEIWDDDDSVEGNGGGPKSAEWEASCKWDRLLERRVKRELEETRRAERKIGEREKRRRAEEAERARKQSEVRQEGLDGKIGDGPYGIIEVYKIVRYGSWLEKIIFFVPLLILTVVYGWIALFVGGVAIAILLLIFGVIH